MLYTLKMFSPIVMLLLAVLTCVTFASAAPDHHLMHPLVDRDNVGKRQSSGKMVYAHFIVRVSSQRCGWSIGSRRVTL